MIVIPRSRSTCSLSRYLRATQHRVGAGACRVCVRPYCARPFFTVPVISSSRSDIVLFPWSMCAMIEKFRMRSVGTFAKAFSSPVAFLECDDENLCWEQTPPDSLEAEQQSPETASAAMPPTGSRVRTHAPRALCTGIIVFTSVLTKLFPHRHNDIYYAKTLDTDGVNTHARTNRKGVWWCFFCPSCVWDSVPVHSSFMHA